LRCWHRLAKAEGVLSTPLVSVIVPAYNHGRFIARCLESVLNQTYQHWELIVVDDGSTDDTAAIVKTFNDPRISYVYQANRGVGDLAGTLNVGLNRTQGELVTMLASDDTWPAYRIEKQIPIFAETQVCLVFGRGLIIDENDAVVGQVPGPPDIESRENRPPGVALRRMFVANYLPQYTVLIRRSALEEIGGYLQPRGLFAEDYPTHMTLALKGEFRFLDMELGNYRMHQNQMTRNHFNEMVLTDIPFVMEFFRRLDPTVKERTGWTEQALSIALAERLNRSYFEIGRRYLLMKEWSKARGQFMNSIRKGRVNAKLRATIGIACSILRTDLEWLAKLAGRPPLR